MSVNNTVTINSVDYELAPSGPGLPPPVKWGSHGSNHFKLHRTDIVPGELPNEYWWLYRGGGAGIGPTFYRGPSRVRVGNSLTYQSSGVDMAYPGLLTLAGGKIFTKTHTDTGQADQAGFAEENSQLLFISDGTAWLIGAGNLSSDTDFTGAPVSDAAAHAHNVIMHQGVIFVGTGAKIARRSAGTWTATTLATDYLHVSPDVVWRSYVSGGYYYISSCALDANPMTSGNWSSGTLIGPVSDPITGLADDGDDLVIARTSGLYIKTPNDVFFNAFREVHAHGSNGKGTTNALGFILYPSITGLVGYRQGRVYYNCGPEAQTDETSQIGFCQAITVRAGWIYAMFQGANVQRLFKARLRTASDPPGGPFVWFPWAYNVFAGTGNGTSQLAAFISNIDVDSRTELMLWLGRDSSVVSYFLQLQNEGQYDSGTSEAVTAMPSTGTIVLPDDDFGFPGAAKTFVEIFCMGRNIASDAAVDFQANVDGSDTGALSMTTSGTRVSFGAQGKTGKYMTDLRLTLNRDASSSTALSPAVELVAIRFFVRPSQARTVQLRILAADLIQLGQGRWASVGAETAVSNHYTLVDENATPFVTFRDETDTTYTIMLTPPAEAERILMPHEENPYYVITLNGFVL